MSIMVYGAPVSPFVRKVLFFLDHNELDYQNDPIVPIEKTDDFLKLSPLGKIPVFKNEEITLPDSSAICAYIDAKYGQAQGKSLLPSDALNKAKALWFEELADTKLIELIGGGIFFERVAKPKFMNEPTDEAKVKETIEETLPPILDYLESQTPNQGYLLGDDLSLADIAIGSVFVNARYAQYQVDAQRWPKLAAYLDRLLSTSGFKKRMADDQAMMGA